MTSSENRLVVYLFERGIVGRDKAVRRSVLATLLSVSVRELRELSEAARLDGHFVGYSSSSEDGGIYLAENDDERVEMFNKIRGECLRRLKQYSALKKSLVDSRQSRIPFDKPPGAG